MIVRACEEKDVEQICDIYNYYVDNTVITFEETAVSISEMRGRLQSITKVYPWLVCESGGLVIGYAYASRWKERVAYNKTSEATVYLRHGEQGNGYGKALYTALIHELKTRSFHVVVGCIAVPNEASIGLHESLGFKKVAQFSEVGFKFNQWLDIGYWQLTLSSDAPNRQFSPATIQRPRPAQKKPPAKTSADCARSGVGVSH